jgi:catechol 2,3-dioxygenase-like lactoylglutathione lyase family enzyme
MTSIAPGIGLIGLSHVSLNTSDLAATERFYVEVLGGRKVFDLTSAATGVRYGTFIDLGCGTFVEIFNQPRSMFQATTVYRHICLLVRSVEQAAAWLSKFGFAPEIKVGRVDKVPQFFITGPDGVEIEFHEYCEGTLQRAHLPDGR